MVDYMITAQAEVLSEKAYRILAKCFKAKKSKDTKYTDCFENIEYNLVLLAKRVILAKTQEEID